MPKLSIIVPVYNNGVLLKYSIESVQKQKYQDYELLLIDDGSNDGTEVFCDEIAKRDSRIRVIHKKNGGAGAARNTGIKESKGEYITFFDADDFYKPEMLQNMMKAIESNKSDLVICSYENVKVDNRGTCFEISPQYLGDYVTYTKQETRKLWFEIRKINISLLNTPWNKIYRRDIIEKYNIQYPNLRRAQDAVFNLYYYDRISTVCVLGQCLYQYNANDLIKTGKKFPKDVYKCFMEYNKVMEEIVTGWGMYEGEYKTLCDNNLLGNIDNCVELCDNPVWNLSKREQLQYLQGIVEDTYLNQRLYQYTGNVSEIEDIIKPVLDKNPKGILKTLKKRKVVENLKESYIGDIVRKIKHFRR